MNAILKQLKQNFLKKALFYKAPFYCSLFTFKKMQNFILPKTKNKRLLNWAKKDNVQNIFKSWFKMYGGNLSDEKFLKLSQITYKIHVKANLV
tara:strand:- start:302 stop:580 length:279 start_codon:yes stop_codon:yes gene_type:complete